MLTRGQEKEAKAAKIKREKADQNPRPRKIARPSVGSTQLEVRDDGQVRAASTPTLAEEREIIELD